MNKAFLFIALSVSGLFVYLALGEAQKVIHLKKELARLKANNTAIQQKIRARGSLTKLPPIPMPEAYRFFLNQIRLIENYSGAKMDVQLEEGKPLEIISTHYKDAPYKDVKALRIKMLVNRVPEEEGIGMILDDMHLLEKNTDFMVMEVNRESHALTVKGELYGV
jgi:hypothetical protein